MRTRFFFLLATTLTASFVSGLSQFSSTRLSNAADGSPAVWTEADLLTEKAKITSDENDMTPIQRNVHIKAELLSPRSQFSNLQELVKTGNANDETNPNTDNIFATKIVHFQRHGQGYHNLLGDVLRDVGVRPDIFSSDPAINPWIRPEIVDSPLTELGKRQCEGQRPVASLLYPEVVIVSPLRRAIETATLSFADYRATGAENSDGDIPWIVHEGCREETGFLICNKRRRLSEIKADFPELQFPSDMTDEDTIFDPSKFESEYHKGERIYDFLVNFLAERPEQNIAVVCHSAWLSHMCNNVLDCAGDTKLTSWFDVSEIRSMRLTFSTTGTTEEKAETAL